MEETELVLKTLNSLGKYIRFTGFSVDYQRNPRVTFVLTVETPLGRLTEEIDLTSDVAPQLEEMNMKLRAQSKLIELLVHLQRNSDIAVCKDKYWYKSPIEEGKQYFVDHQLKLWEKSGERITEVKF